MIQLDKEFDAILHEIKSKDFKGPDLSDIISQQPFLFFAIINNKNYLGKIINKPFSIIAKKYNKYLREYLGYNKTQKFAQVHALIISALITRYKVKSNSEYLETIEYLFEDIFSFRNKDFDLHCWGQPYDWPSRHMMKKNTPRATVSSQVASVCLEYYLLTGKEKYLSIAEEVCEVFMLHFNYTPDKDGDYCLSYTTKDNYHVHNPSMMVAALFYEVANVTKSKKLFDFANHLINFTVKHQNEDGSWYYRALPDKIQGVIDNYHTGYVLESFVKILNIKENEVYKKAYEKGLQYYEDHFFTEDFESKLRHNRTFPIDIQSCAQSIITLSFANQYQYSKKRKNLISNILSWTMNNMFDNDSKQFYYQKYQNNKVDKSSFLRWGDAWMLIGLALVIKQNKND